MLSVYNQIVDVYINLVYDITKAGLYCQFTNNIYLKLSL